MFISSYKFGLFDDHVLLSTRGEIRTLLNSLGWLTLILAHLEIACPLLSPFMLALVSSLLVQKASAPEPPGTFWNFEASYLASWLVLNKLLDKRHLQQHGWRFLCLRSFEAGQEQGERGCRTLGNQGTLTARGNKRRRPRRFETVPGKAGCLACFLLPLLEN